MTEKPLFIPLMRKYFEKFEDGSKSLEFRPYGVRWNERTCRVGRRVVLSLGYGTARRLEGTLMGFGVSTAACHGRAWIDCYGPGERKVACLLIEVTR